MERRHARAAGSDPDRRVRQLRRDPRPHGSRVAAEVRWGNRVERQWFVDRHLGGAVLRLRDPLHVDLLRETFAFPPGFVFRSIGPRPDRAPTLALADPRHVAISGALPPGRPAVDAEEPA